MRAVLGLILAILAGIVVLTGQGSVSAVVERASGRFVTTSWGDQIIVTDVEAVGDERRYRWTSQGGTVRDLSMGASDQPIYRVGDHVQIHDGFVDGGSSPFATFGAVWPTMPVSYLVNPATIQITSDQLVAATDVAAQVWTSAGSHLVFQNAGANGTFTAANDGRNTVFMRDDSGQGYVAITYFWWTGTSITGMFMTDFDIVLNARYVWGVHPDECVGFFVENTLTHEFGHALGLDHSTDPDATMWPYTTSCETTRETLAQDDLDGLFSLYGANWPPQPSGGKPCRKRGRWAC